VQIIQKNQRNSWVEGCVPIVLDTWRQKGYFLVLDPSKGKDILSKFKKYYSTALPTPLISLSLSSPSSSSSSVSKP
jgi:hypothetical protein